LGTITSLDLAAIDEALQEGDGLATRLDAATDDLQRKRAQADLAIEDWRLGPVTRDHVEQLDTASDSIEKVSGYWRDLARDARLVSALVDALLRHDGLVFRATTAGRQANWAAALGFLDQARGPFGEATEVRNDLDGRGNVDTLDDLLGRYEAYDAALTELYAYIRDTGNQTGSAFDALQVEVERTQALLPSDTTAMTVVVGEAAGPTITEALVSIEGAHGDALAALAAVNGDGEAPPADAQPSEAAS
jgi:hypothetical protein